VELLRSNLVLGLLDLLVVLLVLLVATTLGCGLHLGGLGEQRVLDL
jgi:hypothetical protein